MRNIPSYLTLCITVLLVSACTAAPSPTTTPTIPPTLTPTFTQTIEAPPTLTSTLTLTLTSTLTPSPTHHPDTAPVFAPIPVTFFSNGSREKPYVALTFDLCQIPEYPAWFAPQIVETLQRYHAPATFFMGGDWMRTHPQETLLLAADPRFELGNHSWSHPDFRELSEAEIGQEIVKTQDMLYKLTGRESHLFRLPFGYKSDAALGVIAEHGLTTIQWDTETGDPDPNIGAEDIQRLVRERAQNGSIIIMHANGRGWHTPEALPGVIEYLQSQGYTLVTVSQLLGLEPMP